MSKNRMPLIGLTGRRKPGSEIAGFPGALVNSKLDLYFADYASGVFEAGGLAVHIPVDTDSEAMVDQLDALVLSGGTDIDPAQYGAESHLELLTPEPERDAAELGLISAAIEADIPVLGICRGIQMLNVYHGGTLHQHVPSHSHFEEPGSMLAHEIEIEPGTTLRELYGERLKVNSLHHQTIDKLGLGCLASARAVDGTVEGIEIGDKILGVQWHPEMLTTRAAGTVFSWLIRRAS